MTAAPYTPLVGVTHGVFRRLQSGAWIPVSRRFQTEEQAARCIESLPHKDWVVEVRPIAPEAAA